jgi:hypothetical protein
LVGRPRGRRCGGGTAGRLDSIQDRTSAKVQQSLRLLGSFRGRGIKWWYFWFDEQVRIVVTDLPMITASSSMKTSCTVAESGAASKAILLSPVGGYEPIVEQTTVFFGLTKVRIPCGAFRQKSSIGGEVTQQPT